MNSNIELFDNKEKGLQYSKQIERLEKAIKNEYYYEALIIDYNLIDDRLSSILYYLNLIDENKSCFNSNFRKIKDKILFREFPRRKYLDDDSLSEVSVKIKIIKFIINNYKYKDIFNANLKYYNILNNNLNEIEIPKLRKCLIEIDKWRIKRNRIVHELFKNKKVLYVDVSELAEEGYMFARELDRQCGFIKRKKIRNLF